MVIRKWEFPCPRCQEGRVRGHHAPGWLPAVPPREATNGGKFVAEADCPRCRCPVEELGRWVDTYGLPADAVEVSHQPLGGWTPAFHPTFPVGTWGLPPGWEASLVPADGGDPMSREIWSWWPPRGEGNPPSRVALDIAPLPRRGPIHSAFFPGLRADDAREVEISLAEGNKVTAVLERGDTLLLADFELGDLALSLKVFLAPLSRDDTLRAIGGIWYSPAYWSEASPSASQTRPPLDPTSGELEEATTGEFVAVAPEPAGEDPVLPFEVGGVQLVLHLEGALSVAVDKFPFKIGRRNSCDLAIKNGNLSARHCQILHEGGHYVLEDLGSTNGIAQLRGDEAQQTDRASIKDGDCFLLGRAVALRCELRPAPRS